MTPYPEQLDAVKTAALKHRGIISAITGSGKSLMIGLLIQELQVRTIIVTPSIELKEQLSASMINWFGRDKVGKGKDIYVENVQTLKAILGYDCIIIDEFHHGAAKTYRNLNKAAWKDIYYRFGFTSTPFRNVTEETLLLEGLLSEVIYKLDYKKAAFKGYICPIEGYYIEMTKVKTDAYSWSEVYSQLVVDNMPRNEAIAWLLLNLNAQSKATLCLVKEVRHGALIESLTGIPFANGKDEDSRKYIKQFAEGKITSLIGTTGILGEGIDCKPCEYVIICGLGKAKSALMQQIGRAVRTYPGKESAKIILIKDRSHKFLLRHFNIQVSILKDEYGVVLTKLEI